MTVHSPILELDDTGVTPPRNQDEARISFIHFANILLRHRGWVLLTPLLASILVVGWTLTRPRTFTAKASFMPQSAQSAAGTLSGVAAQLGIRMSTSDAPPPQLYADLIHGPTILQDAATVQYTVEGGRKITLAQAFDIARPTPMGTREAVIDALDDIITTDVDPRTGVIDLAVTTQSPVLSRAIADRLLARVNGTSIQMRLAQARTERQFTQDRLADARADLRRAEERLEEFQLSNRVYQDNPRLMFQFTQLSRDVRLQEQVYMSLAQILENSSVESMRDTPALTIIEPPQAPFYPDPRRLVLHAVMAILCGFFLGVLVALMREYVLNSERSSPQDVAEFRTLWRNGIADLRHPIRAMRGR